MKVPLAPQVVDFVRSLAPVPRQQLRRALRDLERDKGDIKLLEGMLQSYCRLRVGSYRVVLSYGKPGVVECVFAERRSIVYEVFADALVERMTRNA